jgi:AcrR family transcriptional regulator
MTFYRHFDDMEDLLVSGFEGLRAFLKERQREALSRRSSVDDRVFAFSRELFVHAKEHREVFRLMARGDSGVLIQHLLHKLPIELLHEDVKATGSTSNANSIPGRRSSSLSLAASSAC